MRPINKRNKYKNIGNRNIFNKNIERMKDARQILKLKRNKQQMKSFYSPKTNFTRKQFKPVISERISSGKQVLIKKGMITVTSEQIPVSDSNEVITSTEKFVFADKNGITVTKRNSMPTSKLSPINHISQTENDMSCVDDDDLEKMTLDDLPEANKLKTITSNFQDNFDTLQSRTNSQATSRMQNHTDSTNGYNILVTNLHREVSKTDIVELFSDLGTIADVQMIQPGTALVTYINKDEAILACETYHNRLLDGQPMQCTLLPSVTSLIKPPGRFLNRLSPMVYAAGKSSASTSHFSSLHQVSRTSSPTNTPGRPVNFTVRMP